MFLKKIIIFYTYLLSVSYLQTGANVPVTQTTKKSFNVGNAVNSLAKVGSYFLDSPDASKSPTGAIVQNLTQNIVDNAAKKYIGVGLGDIRNLRNMAYILDFFIGFPSNFIKNQGEWNYNTSQIVIKNTSSATKLLRALANSNVSVDDGSSNQFIPITTLTCDVQFKGHGDLNSPIGFKIVNGKYYYTPGQNLFTIQTDKQSPSKVKNLLDASFRTSVLGVLSLLQNQRLGISTDFVSQLLDRSSVLYPQDIFVIKVIQLFNTATQNSLEGTAYPRIAHIPLELMLLTHRLLITPDYEATMKNHDSSIKFAYQWDPQKIIYYQTPMDAVMKSLLFVSDVLGDSIGLSLKITTNQEDWDDYQASKKTSPSDIILGQNLADLWKVDGYLQRSDVILNKLILQQNFVMYSAKEQRRFINNIVYHLSQRLKGFLTYAAMYEQMQVGTTSSADSSSSLLSSDNQGLVSLELLIKALNSRNPKVKAIVEATLNILNKFPSSNNQFLQAAVDYLTSLPAKIDEETSDLNKKIVSILDDQAKYLDGKLTISQRNTALNSMRKKIAALSETVAKIESESFPNLNSIKTDSQIQVNVIPDFFAMKFFSLKSCEAYKFRGDTGFIFDPVPLSEKETINKIMAIILRLAFDYKKAEDLFKQDPNVYKMYDLSGKLVDVVGQKIYAETQETKQKLIVSAEKQAYDAKQDALKNGSVTSSISLDDYSGRIDQVGASLTLKWSNFLCQYHFDRRKKDILLESLSATSSVADLKSKLDTEQKKTIASDLENFITNKQIFGTTASMTYAKEVAQQLIVFLQKMINDILRASKQNQQVSIETNLANKNADMMELKDSAGTTNDATTKMTNLTNEIALLEKDLTKVKSQIQNISDLTAWLSGLSDKVMNYSATAASQTAIKNLFSQNPTLFNIAQALITQISTDGSFASVISFFADLYAAKNNYNNFVTVLSKSSAGAFKILESQPNSADQQALLATAFNSAFNSTLFSDVLVSKISVLEKATTQTLLSKIFENSSWSDSAVSDLLQVVAPSSTTTAAASSSSVAAPAANSNAKFLSLSTDYPDSLYSFLLEEFWQLSLSSSLAEYIPMYIDPILISLTGCNFATFSSIFAPLQQSLMRKDLLELVNDSSKFDNEVKIPQELIDKIKASAATNSEITFVPGVSELNQAELAELEAAQVIVPAATYVIAPGVGTVLDQQIGLTVTSNVDEAASNAQAQSDAQMGFEVDNTSSTTEPTAQDPAPTDATA